MYSQKRKRSSSHSGSYSRKRARTTKRIGGKPASAWGDASVTSAKLGFQASTVVSGVTAQFGAIHFQADQFNGFTDFAAAFDAYRLLKCVVMFFPKVNDHTLTQLATPAVSSVPPIVTVKDYDDSVAVTSLSDLLQYGNFEVHNQFAPFAVEIYPKISMAAYQSGAFTGYAQADGTTWIDCASDDVEHYGIKWGTNSTGASQTTFQEWIVYVKGWFQFRQNR